MKLGISLDENFVYVNIYGEDIVTSFPFSLGKNLRSKNWFIGEEARSENVDNVDIVIDKLYYIMENSGRACIDGVEYSAKDLVRIFFDNLFNKYTNIEYVTITIRKSNVGIFATLKSACYKYFKDYNKFKISTYSEAFVKYLTTQDESVYGDFVGLFNFTEKAITFYELEICPFEDKDVYWRIITKDYLELPLDLLSADSGVKLCDKLLTKFAKECFNDRVFANIILTGVGFTESQGYREFMNLVCGMGNVSTDVNFFAKAASLISNFELNKTHFDMKFLTDARTNASISLFVTYNQESRRIELVKAGEEWFSIHQYSFQVIADESETLEFEVVKIVDSVVKQFTLSIPMDMIQRDDKTNLIEVVMTYTQQNYIDFVLNDKGFGEFFESANISHTYSEII